MSESHVSSPAAILKQGLADADRETQLEIMKDWFYERYEDPAERTPYQSAEGGYIWIWGGPYNAREELEAEFADTVPSDVIDELVGALEEECYQWAPTPSPEDYDNYLIDDIAGITEYYHNFCGAILDIEKLLETDVHSSVSVSFHRLMFVNVITALEAYLSDAFINTVVNDPGLMRRFVETTPEFRAEKIPVSEIFSAIERIEQKARSHLIDVVWHRLDRVANMYRSSLGITFSKEMGSLLKATLVRHDIVHRNGKDKAGNEVLVTREQIENLILQVEAFVQHVDGQLASLKRCLIPK